MIRFERSTRADSRGFSLWVKRAAAWTVVRFAISLHWWRIWEYQQCVATQKVSRQRDRLGWLLTVQVGRGAGYRWGRTLYLGWRVRGGSPLRDDRTPYRTQLRAGFTQDSNRVPYGFA